MKITIQIDESQRQLIILALAKLSMERPGWTNMLNETALLMDPPNEQGDSKMFTNFRHIWVSPLVEKLTA